MFLMFVVNLMHEFKIGVWRTIFTHLMRILNVVGGNAVQLLNERWVLLDVLGSFEVLTNLN